MDVCCFQLLRATASRFPQVCVACVACFPPLPSPTSCFQWCLWYSFVLFCFLARPLLALLVDALSSALPCPTDARARRDQSRSVVGVAWFRPCAFRIACLTASVFFGFRCCFPFRCVIFVDILTSGSVVFATACSSAAMLCLSFRPCEYLRKEFHKFLQVVPFEHLRKEFHKFLQVVPFDTSKKSSRSFCSACVRLPVFHCLSLLSLLACLFRLVCLSIDFLLVFVLSESAFSSFVFWCFHRNRFLFGVSTFLYWSAWLLRVLFVFLRLLIACVMVM